MLELGIRGGVVGEEEEGEGGEVGGGEDGETKNLLNL